MSTLLTAQQVADIFNVDRKTIYRWAERGLLPFKRGAKGWRWFDPEEVRRLAAVTEATSKQAWRIEVVAARTTPVRRGIDLIDTEEY